MLPLADFWSILALRAAATVIPGLVQLNRAGFEAKLTGKDDRNEQVVIFFLDSFERQKWGSQERVEWGMRKRYEIMLPLNAGAGVIPDAPLNVSALLLLYRWISARLFNSA